MSGEGVHNPADVTALEADIAALADTVAAIEAIVFGQPILAE